jgi:hypothetical protein
VTGGARGPLPDAAASTAFDVELDVADRMDHDGASVAPSGDG